MLEQIDMDAATFWMSALDSPDPEARARAASELNCLKSRARQSVTPRGYLHWPAPPANTQLHAAVQDRLVTATQDPVAMVRLEAAAALAYWGDGAAVAPLARLAVGAEQDPVEGVRRASLRALGEIGGPAAVAALKRLVADPSDEVSGEAVDAAWALAAHSKQQDLAGPAANGRGVVRRVVGRPTDEANRQASALAEALDLLTTSERHPYLRQLAQAALDAIEAAG